MSVHDFHPFSNWIVSLLFRLLPIHWFSLTLSPSIQFYISLIVFLGFNISICFLIPSIILLRLTISWLKLSLFSDSIFFICFKCLYPSSLTHFCGDFFKIFSENSNISVTWHQHLLIAFSFRLRSPWFLVWQVIFHWSPDISGIMWWDWNLI